ncbi:YveK family protein [Clostridium akagii]|uniref:YveK family protein n=1 Tax=Clostridium akagii TaxID=91623 RepID=UPI00047AF88F|nr:Wzz/FepE/Etk N-terminal domain-containing protein [Clostridium akagii]
MVKLSKFEVVFFLLLLFYNNFFRIITPFLYMSENNRFNTGNITIFLLVLMLIPFTINIKKINLQDLKFKNQILLFMLLILIASISTNIIYGQPIIKGVQAQKYLFIYLLYFPLMTYLLKNNNNLVRIKKLLIYYGFIQSLLVILQYILLGKINFMVVSVAERFGDTRLNVGGSVVLLSLFLSIDWILNSKENKKLNILIICIELFYFVFINKTRMALIGIVIAIILIALIQTKWSKFKIFYATIFLCLLTLTILSNTIDKYLQLSLKEVGSNSGNYLVRVNEVKYFMTQYIKTPIFGRGFYNNNFAGILNDIGTQYKYYLDDIGIYSFVFYYGIAGILWLIALVGKLLYSILKTKNYFAICYFVYLVATSLTLFDIVYEPFNIVILLTIVSIDYVRKTNKDSYKLEEWRLSERRIINEIIKKAWLIALIVLLSTGGSVLYLKHNNIKSYKATATVYAIAKSGSLPQNNAQGSVNYSNVLVGQQFSKDYSEIIKGDDVVRTVINKLGLRNITTDELSSQVSLSLADQSNVVEISVIDNNATRAKDLANAFSQALIDKMAKLTGQSTLSSIDNAQIPNSPVPRGTSTLVLIVFLASFLIASGIVVVIAHKDKTAKTVEDIEIGLGYGIIGIIPKMNIK